MKESKLDLKCDDCLIKSFKKINLGESDILIIKIDEANMPKNEIQRLKKHARKILDEMGKDNKIMFSGKDIKLFSMEKEDCG